MGRGGGRRCAIVLRDLRAAVRDGWTRWTSREAVSNDAHHGVEHVVSVDEAQNWRCHVGGRVGESPGSMCASVGVPNAFENPARRGPRFSDFVEIDAPRTAFNMNARATGGQYTVTLRV